jgi:nucleoside-diphosphate-sugar epimerase
LKTIYITGSSGFVGKNILRKLNLFFSFNEHKRNCLININQDVVIHCAGLAHDLKDSTNFDDYYRDNTKLTETVFDAFLNSNAKVFIALSSVKAVADYVEVELTEDFPPNPSTNYGKSKLLAEEYILGKITKTDKRIYILRPCMIHGPENKGNLNLLFNFVKNGIVWPLGKFNNKRSYCSIDNLIFLINELINNNHIKSGVYNVADDEAISTTELVKLISKTIGKRIKILYIPKIIIFIFCFFGDLFKFKVNTESLNKLTENYIVSNRKIKLAINKELPLTTKDGLINTLGFFKSISK